MRFAAVLCVCVILASAAVCGGCSSDTATPEPSYIKDTYWRVSILGGPSSAKIERVDLVESALDFVPNLAPEYMIVAYSQGTPTAALAVRFPASGIIESEDAAGAAESVRFRVTEGVTVAYLQAAPEIDRLALLDKTQNVLDERTGSALPRPGRADGALRRALGTSRISAKYPHIRVLTPADGALVPDYVKNALLGPIVDPTPQQEDKIIAGLALCAPGALQATRTIVFIDADTKGRAASTGSTIGFNVKAFSQPKYSGTVVHEVMHTVSSLYDIGTDYSAWPAALRDLAWQRAEVHGLQRGVLTIWNEMHSRAAQSKLVGDYSETQLPPVAALDNGFAAPYGGTGPFEDFATYGETVQAPSHTLRGHGQCPRLGSTLTKDLALPFLKVSLLRAIGAVSESRYRECVGSTTVGGPSGIDLGKGDLTLTVDPQAGFLEQAGQTMFAVTAKGPDTYGAVLRLRASTTNALGFHRLDNIVTGGLAATIERIRSTTNALLLANDNNLKARASGEGLVIVTKTGGDYEGLILGLTLKNQLGEVTDYLPLSTFRVP